MFYNDLIQTPIVSVNRQNILYKIAAQNYLQFFAALEKAFYQGRKLYWSWSNGPLVALQRQWGLGNLNSAFEKSDS
jgi:hypothetical protein